MQNNNFILVCATLIFLASTYASAAEPTKAIKDSWTTVDELLTLDNARALEKARRDAAAEGVGSAIAPVAGKTDKKPAAPPPPPPPAVLEVESIAGLGNELHSRVFYNGIAQTVSVGSKVGPCEVVTIADRQVTLKPISKTAKNQCPSGTWTGVQRTMMIAQPAGLGNAGIGKAPLSVPPLIPIGAGAVPVAPVVQAPR